MAKKKTLITNAMRHLTSCKIPFEPIFYEADEIGENFGVKIAELTGLPSEKSFKTLVAKGDKIMVVCVPVNAEVDLKKLAKAAGEKKVELVGVRDLLGLTGYIRGGVSPLGMKKKYDTYFHESCMDFDTIAISGGACGVTLLMNPSDLLSAVSAHTFDLIKSKNSL